MNIIPQQCNAEVAGRIGRIASELAARGIDAILLSNFANLYYTSGRVYCGYAYITATGCVTYFVKRPNGLEGDNVVYIRKPEQIADFIAGASRPLTVAMELGIASYNTIERLKGIFTDATIADATPIINKVRSVKSEFEINKLKECGVHHATAYHNIEKVYRSGMSDIELQIEIERILRSEGCLGQFRIAGDTMELFMGNLLCGVNAETPSPYDFAMGGGGLDESLPVGCNGSLIKQGNTVMVDMCGNFNGYMTDMTRVFRIGEIGELARKAHSLSITIHHRLATMAKPGVEAKALYEEAMKIVKDAGLEEYFMGLKQKAGFIGHGVGIEVNELPVIAPRSRDVLQAGNVIALEPKFVIPQVGAVGIENTYVVRDSGLECLTNFPEDIQELY